MTKTYSLTYYGIFYAWCRIYFNNCCRVVWLQSLLNFQLGATTFGMTTLSIKGLYMTLSISDTRHNRHSIKTLTLCWVSYFINYLLSWVSLLIILHVVMLSFVMLNFNMLIVIVMSEAFYLLLSWVSMCWMSLWWVSWRLQVSML
jgi:hypothetical protein